MNGARMLLAVVISAAAIHPLWAADTAIPEGIFLKSQQADQYLARDLLLGAKVHDADGKIIGDVEDLVLNDHNQVVGVIMGVGGVLGLGEKRIGVRYSALQFAETDGKQVVSLPQATKEVLTALEPYVRSRPPKSFFDSVTEKAKELAAKTGETTSDAYQKAKEQAGPALQQAREKAGQAYETAKEKVREAVDKAKDATRQ